MTGAAIEPRITRRGRVWAAGVGLLAALALLAGCGGSSGTPARAPASAPEASAPSAGGIPQNNGGDQDSDNNGGPSDGDGDL